MVVLSHVALLVRSVVRAAALARELGFRTGPEERWEGEGTLEVYVRRFAAAPLCETA